MLRAYVVSLEKGTAQDWWILLGFVQQRRWPKGTAYSVINPPSCLPVGPSPACCAQPTSYLRTVGVV